MQNYQNPVLRAMQAKSGQGGPKLAIRYKGSRGLSSVPSPHAMNMSVAPRTAPDDSNWYMNARQPNWTPVLYQQTTKAPTRRQATVEASQPTKMDREYLATAEALGETPGYQPAPANVRVSASPYRWTGWF